MNEPDLYVQHFYITIDDVPERHLVAKLQRVSSPPVKVGSVSDSLASSIGRLVDIIRLGDESCNYGDLKIMLLETRSKTSAAKEWDKYSTFMCLAMGIQRLEPFTSIPHWIPTEEGSPVVNVTFHDAMMNNRPYVVARVGEVMGSPAATFLTWPQERVRALFRLYDVFRIGVQGQVFRDFVEQSRRIGKQEADILEEWKSYEQSVIWDIQHNEHPSPMTCEGLRRFLT